MAGQAVDRRPPLLVTIEAETHRVVDDALCNGHLPDVAVTRHTFHTGPDVRSMIESHVRFLEKPIDTLPRHVFTALRIISQRLNALVPRVANVFMTSHTEVDAGQTGPRTRSHSCMAILAFDADLVDDVNLMRKIDRLLRLVPDT